MNDTVTISTLEKNCREASRVITKLNDNMTVFFYSYSGNGSADLAMTHGMLASTAVGKVLKALAKFEKERKGEEQ